MIGSVAFNEAGVAGVITGCELEEFEDAQVQYRRGNPIMDSEGNQVVKKFVEKRRVAYVGRGLDGNPWRAVQATPLSREQKKALGV